MYSKLFPAEEQLLNIQDEKGFRSRILAYTPEIMMMEWQFFNDGHVIPLHDHYHVQMSYIIKGSATVILADGTEKLCRAGDAVAFAPNEAHSVITAEPDTVIMDVFNPVRLDHLENHKKA
ncbi:MAG: cupin domain-containing protein [Oscillospiraceae bacterium]|nr:cupin domain-containing protein [Oscillospiraceae bacterium]